MVPMNIINLIKHIFSKYLGKLETNTPLYSIKMNIHSS